MGFALNNPTIELAAFLRNLKFSYYEFGPNALANSLPASYVERSAGVFNQTAVDANIVRNVGICIIFTIVLFVMTIVQMIYNKPKTEDE
jgi:hypothetical protein